MSIDRLQIIYEKLQRKDHVWYSIIKAIETATTKLRKQVKTSYDRIALSSISTQITKARKEHSIFQTKLNQIKDSMKYNTPSSSYYDLKTRLNELNIEAQSAIEKLRDIARDIVDIQDLNSTTSETIKIKQDKDKDNAPKPKPPTPPSASITQDEAYDNSTTRYYKTTKYETVNNHKEISSSSSPSSTMVRQRTEIAEIRDRIKQLRDHIPEMTQNQKDSSDSMEMFDIERKISSKVANKSTQQTITKTITVQRSEYPDKNKQRKNVFDFQQKEYLRKFDKFGNIQHDLDKTWNDLDTALDQNVMSNKIIADELKDLRQKINEYQKIVQCAAELCHNSARVINDKNQDLNAVISEKQMIEEQWTETKTQLENMKNSKSNIDAAYKKQCVLNDDLQKENEDLRDTLTNMQHEFQTEIDTLKEELNAQIKFSKHKQQMSYEAERGNFESRLDALLRQLEIEDENAKHEILNIMKSYRKKRQRMFRDAKQEDY